MKHIPVIDLSPVARKGKDQSIQAEVQRLFLDSSGSSSQLES
jgi:hypothetical protein